MLNERVRYSRFDDGRKNTLVTVRNGDQIFFGVARCNLTAGDTMRKSQGRMIASARALKAKTESDLSGFFQDGMFVHSSGLRGFCRVDEIKTLLQYFDNVDAEMKRRNSDEDTI